MNKHILVFLAFNNVEHIKKSFDSMYCDDIDYFIIENKSKYSEEIQNYFLKQKEIGNNIVKYIQFEKNIAANAVNIAIKDYITFFKQYEYFTYTDGDYYIYDIKSTIQEILSAFSHPDCAISSVELYPFSNWRQHSNRILGVEHYINYMRARENISPISRIGIGVPSLMTLSQKDLGIIENIYFLDGNIRARLHAIGRTWYITAKNLSYHLTDECCYDEFRGDEYMTWKRNVGNIIWNITENSDYVVII